MLNFLEKLFGKKKPAASNNVQTAPLTEEQLATVSSMEVSMRPMQVIVGSAQSVGRQRDHNEDSLFCLNTVLSDNTTELPFGIFIVADGMGGHQHGEVASGVTTRVVSQYVINRVLMPMLGVNPEMPSESLQEVMEASVKEAQQAVVKKAPGGGTTLTAALVMGEQVTLAHVGDSRAYFIYPDGRMQAITQDHSLVHRLVELGQITEKDALTHPQRNVLYRAVGQADTFRPDIYTHRVPYPGYLMICSDGLWGVVPETEVFRIIKTASNPTNACFQLVEAANLAGGPDNISVVLIQFTS